LERLGASCASVGAANVRVHAHSVISRIASVCLSHRLGSIRQSNDGPQEGKMTDEQT